MRCGENIREMDDGLTTDRPFLVYGKIFSHRVRTGLISTRGLVVRSYFWKVKYVLLPYLTVLFVKLSHL